MRFRSAALHGEWTLPEKSSVPPHVSRCVRRDQTRHTRMFVIALILFLGDSTPQEHRIPREQCAAIVDALKARAEVYAHDRETSITRQIQSATCLEAAS